MPDEDVPCVVRGLQQAGNEADTYIRTLRGHMRLLIPEVEAAALRGPDDAAKYCALACVGEASRKIDLAGRGVSYGVPHARRLARSVNALCDHYENLGGAP